MPNEWPKRFCCEEDLALIGYDGRDAASDLAKWRDSGPRRTTQELIDVIRSRGVEGANVLDIGAGVGAIHTALLEAGAARAVDVDASREYLATAQAEAERRGLSNRIDYRYGDVVELAAELPPADIVTLDSVICCYPYLRSLFAAALSPSPRLVGLTYPRDVWWMVAFMRLYNFWQALRRSPLRYFIHRSTEVDRLMAEAGFVNSYAGGIRRWQVVVYARA
jgi:SAM-dependent methyltransferase